MKTSIELLDELKARRGFTSDYQLCKMLGTTTSRMGNYRSGRATLDDVMALRVARELQLDAGLVLTWIHAERALRMEQGDVFKVLEQFAKKAQGMGRKAAAVLLAAIFAMPLSPSPAEASQGAPGTGTIYTLCALRARASRLIRRALLISGYCQAAA